MSNLLLQDDENASQAESDKGQGSGKKEKWVDMDRAINRNMRAYANWVRDAEVKCKNAWTSLWNVEREEKTVAVADKVQHDLDIAKARCKAIGHVLGYDANSEVAEPAKLPPPEQEKQLSAFIEECKAREAALAVASSGGGSRAEGLAAASVASAAGERSQLGQGPPCKSFINLRTFASLSSAADEFMACVDQDDIQDLNLKTKPWKQAVQELIVLGGSIGKDLKGAVLAAQKRVQQTQEKETKSRKAAAATEQKGASKAVSLFEVIPSLVSSGNSKILQLPIGKADEKNDYSHPFMVNIPADAGLWKDLAPCVTKLLADFRLEFENSPLRSTAGRAMKGLDKLCSDPDIEQKVNEAIFAKFVQVADRVTADNDEKKAVIGAASACGVAKDTVTCVPEKGYMAIGCMVVAGSANVVLFPLCPVMDFFASHEGMPHMPIKDVLVRLKSISSETLQKLLAHIGEDGRDCSMPHPE